MCRHTQQKKKIHGVDFWARTSIDQPANQSVTREKCESGRKTSECLNYGNTTTQCHTPAMENEKQQQRNKTKKTENVLMLTVESNSDIQW